MGVQTEVPKVEQAHIVVEEIAEEQDAIAAAPVIVPKAKDPSAALKARNHMSHSERGLFIPRARYQNNYSATKRIKPWRTGVKSQQQPARAGGIKRNSGQHK